MNSISRFSQITSASSWTKATSRDVLTFVHFTSARSASCKALAPILTSLSKQAEYRKVSFVKLDVDKLTEVAKNANIMTVPSFQCYRGGVCLESFAGAVPQKMVSMLDAHLRVTNDAEVKSSPVKKVLSVLIAAALAVGGFVWFQQEERKKHETLMAAAEAGQSCDEENTGTTEVSRMADGKVDSLQN
ncbi:hypothetical protein CYMTET_21577, partial [Cymbomonas tetramitiformis]